MPSEILKKTSTRYRTVPARGINADGEKPIEREGGDQRAGLIRGMAVVTRGEALGHGHWCDEDFLSQVAAAINASDHGAKARFTHPGLSGDGLGRFLGRAKTATVDEDLVRGDLHFSKSAHKTPDGDPMFDHTMEGPDDMPAHIRSILSKMDLSFPVTSGRSALGTWQGIYLWEHRTRPHSRKVTVTVMGD